MEFLVLVTLQAALPCFPLLVSAGVVRSWASG